MPRTSGGATRDKILEVTQDLILQQGFGGTSIDQVLAKAGITKGGFFYHFKNKQDLALALINRYAVFEDNLVTNALHRAEKLSHDPLQQLLIFIGLFIEQMDELKDPYPGCLFAIYTYEAKLFSQEIQDVVTGSILMWRERVGDKIKQAKKLYDTKIPLDDDDLADQLLNIFEGAFVLSKSLEDPKIVVSALIHYRNYLELVFGQTRATD